MDDNEAVPPGVREIWGMMGLTVTDEMAALWVRAGNESVAARGALISLWRADKAQADLAALKAKVEEVCATRDPEGFWVRVFALRDFARGL
jgi:hypothetical protein